MRTTPGAAGRRSVLTMQLLLSLEMKKRDNICVHFDLREKYLSWLILLDMLQALKVGQCLSVCEYRCVYPLYAMLNSRAISKQ